MNTVAGVPLRSFDEPIRMALTDYSERADGRIVFDTEAAHKLELTPNKPNSARSSTTVKHLGEAAGTLVVVVFAPSDGTGDESAHRLKDIKSGGFYPLLPKLVPRSKAAIHSEGHLTIASLFANSPSADPVLFAGHLEVVSLKGGGLAKLAYVGQPFSEYAATTWKETTAEPVVTLTTGYRALDGERFGDPHSIYNYTNQIQVCGFIAVANELADQHGEMLRTLGAIEPVLWF